MRPEPRVYVLSDSVGETAELVVKAGLSQFADTDGIINRVSYVEDKETIDTYVTLAKERNAMIGFTLVDLELRHYLNVQAEKFNIVALDIMGPTLESMEKYLQREPRLEPGLVHQLDEDYFKRIEAIEFAVKYDDGRDPRGIARADIVLVGVSRTSKTPLSQFLANKRIKVANVPIVPEVDPPEELFEVAKEKCIGLRISADTLNEIRKERLKALGLGDEATYATINRINEELAFFDKVVDQIGCQVIDVSHKAIEETANVILQMLKKK